jgi:hypothetical protein
MIKWTDFALSDEFGPLLDLSAIVSSSDIIHDERCDIASSRGGNGRIRIDAAKNGMRIQETESVILPARMVGANGSDDLKLVPTGRKLGSVTLGTESDVQAKGGA